MRERRNVATACGGVVTMGLNEVFSTIGMDVSARNSRTSSA